MLLLDEITVDLDVVGRLQLLAFFKRECEERGATIVYATHIFDGLEGWITHCTYMEDGRILKGGSVCGPVGGGGWGDLGKGEDCRTWFCGLRGQMRYSYNSNRTAARCYGYNSSEPFGPWLSDKGFKNLNSNTLLQR